MFKYRRNVGGGRIRDLVLKCLYKTLGRSGLLPLSQAKLMARVGYRLLSYVGRGSYGVVAKALSLHEGKTVAIKTSSYTSVAEKESSILNFLSPNEYVVGILGQGRAEIVDGCLLEELISNGHKRSGMNSNAVVYIAMEFMDTGSSFINQQRKNFAWRCIY
ncbi:hypothetical protein KI387_024545 [Taxus chinensis]|uniref:Protein kinase domain-containing protein n=1 Tax=Taxus chinensis TaxID=29808 RepID=A0AA38L8Q7_TAXCH|nr:hypothetical protein KI387_024545 [Taxus chinensis]